MEFVRTIPCARCKLVPTKISVTDAAQDFNSVYGVSKTLSKARRTMVNCRLMSQILHGEEMFAVERTNCTGRYRCFIRENVISHREMWRMFNCTFHRNRLDNAVLMTFLMMATWVECFWHKCLSRHLKQTPSVPFKIFLFDTPGRTVGLDLGALDIQRQRDHGIPGYVNYSKYRHSFNVHGWDDLQQFMDSNNISKLKNY